MNMKCIRLIGWNMYILYFLLFRIRYIVASTLYTDNINRNAISPVQRAQYFQSLVPRQAEVIDQSSNQMLARHMYSNHRAHLRHSIHHKHHHQRDGLSNQNSGRNGVSRAAVTESKYMQFNEYKDHDRFTRTSTNPPKKTNVWSTSGRRHWASNANIDPLTLPTFTWNSSAAKTKTFANDRIWLDRTSTTSPATIRLYSTASNGHRVEHGGIPLNGDANYKRRLTIGGINVENNHRKMQHRKTGSGSDATLWNTLDDDSDDDDDDDDEIADYDKYLYLDDEGQADATGAVGSLTEEKWRNYGTHEAVEKSRQRPNTRTREQIQVHNVNAHISRIFSEASCKIPRPKIITIATEPTKTYMPHCTVLHRCSDDTGCCHTDASSCVPKQTQTVDLYFYVWTLGIREPSVETLSFINHTECHCVDRNSLHHRFPTMPVSRTDPPTNNTASDNKKCTCVRHFVAVEEALTDDEKTDEPNSNGKRCRCDCISDNASCEWLKKGKEGFGIEDRSCILDNRCMVPSCAYGQYDLRTGRCPRIEDKFASARHPYLE